MSRRRSGKSTIWPSLALCEQKRYEHPDKNIGDGQKPGQHRKYLFFHPTSEVVFHFMIFFELLFLTTDLAKELSRSYLSGEQRNFTGLL